MKYLINTESMNILQRDNYQIALWMKISYSNYFRLCWNSYCCFYSRSQCRNVRSVQNKTAAVPLLLWCCDAGAT